MADMTFRKLSLYCKTIGSCEVCPIEKECDKYFDDIINNPPKRNGAIVIDDDYEIKDSKNRGLKW